jgi:excisionase family DNA binding protein
MPTISAEKTRTLADRILDIVQSRPGITVGELANELGIDDASDVLVKLRSGLEQVNVDVQPDQRDDGLSAAWGPAPSAPDLAGARWFGPLTVRKALDAALHGALTRDQAAERIGVTPQAISERLKRGKLTALRRGREWRFPAWQFADDGTLPELPKLIAMWPSTPLALSSWAITPNADLDGRSPAEELTRRGGTRRVLELVDAVRAAGW